MLKAKKIVKKVAKGVMNPSIKTKSKKNSMGEIINPTRKDVKKYNAKYKTVRFK